MLHNFSWWELRLEFWGFGIPCLVKTLHSRSLLNLVSFVILFSIYDCVLIPICFPVYLCFNADPISWGISVRLWVVVVIGLRSWHAAPHEVITKKSAVSYFNAWASFILAVKLRQWVTKIAMFLGYEVTFWGSCIPIKKILWRINCYYNSQP